MNTPFPKIALDALYRVPDPLPLSPFSCILCDAHSRKESCEAIGIVLPVALLRYRAAKQEAKSHCHSVITVAASKP